MTGLGSDTVLKRLRRLLVTHRDTPQSGPRGLQCERVVAGQRLVQATSDILLGWGARPPHRWGRDEDYYLRQQRDWELSAQVEQMVQNSMNIDARPWLDPRRRHARAADRIAIAAYLGCSDTFDNAIADCAHTYADQNERDHATLAAAVTAGQGPAQSGL